MLGNLPGMVTTSQDRLLPGKSFRVKNTSGHGIKVTLAFDDGTRVVSELHPGAEVTGIAGTTRFDINIENADEGSPGPRLVTED